MTAGKLLLALAGVVLVSVASKLNAMLDRRAELIEIRYTAPSLSLAPAPSAAQQWISHGIISVHLPTGEPWPTAFNYFAEGTTRK